jgi:hypothetical protein
MIIENNCEFRKRLNERRSYRGQFRLFGVSAAEVVRGQLHKDSIEDYSFIRNWKESVAYSSKKLVLKSTMYSCRNFA